MSLRLRLTLWYVGLLAAILIAFGVGLYSIVSFSLYDEVDTTLESKARDIEVSLATVLAVQNDPMTVLRQGGVLLPKADAFAGSDINVYVQIADLDGSVISKSTNLGSQKFVVRTDELQDVKAGASIYSIFHINATRLRAYVAPLRNANNQVVGVIELAESLREVDTTLATLGARIAGSILAALGIAAIGGAFLARSALAPIDRVSQTARAITLAHDLGKRIETPNTSDEVGRLASTINEMLARIEDLFRVQQRFVADVSHELRSPLTAVRGNLDLLRRGAADDAGAREEGLAAIDSEVARMSRMVADLLMLAQADAGVPIAKESVELDTLLLDVYRQARMSSDGVKVSLGDEDEAIILGDRDRLKQALLNLVGNAVKYTPSGGEVKLSLEKDEEWVRIAVRDTGIGIAPEHISHLFDRFYRVDKARARDAGGAGLGLSIAKSVVDAHNGRITVESQAGKGSKFTIWLPLTLNGQPKRGGPARP
jgi:two-component system, OmpR family, sensor kinase